MKKERFEAITDAVMAIIITIMVLEIKIPELTVANIPKIIQQIFVYAVSFITIAIVWLNHHRIFFHAERISMNVVWINFGLLFLTSLIPLATEHVSESFHEKANHMFYGFVTGATSAFYSLLEQQIMKQTKNEKRNVVNRMNWSAVVLYFLAIPLSDISVYISAAIFVLIPTLYFTLSKKSAD